MTIQATVTIWCDQCGGPQFTYKPPAFMVVGDAKVFAENKAMEAGWGIIHVSHLCPACVSLEKHPAVWTKEANPEHVARLEGG